MALFKLADVFHISGNSSAYVFHRLSSSLKMKTAQSPEMSVQYSYVNNNNYLLQLGCYPLAVVILHVYKI